MSTNVQEFLLLMKEKVEKAVEKEIKETVEAKVCENLEMMISNGIISLEEAQTFAKSQSISLQAYRKKTKVLPKNTTFCGSRCSCTTN